MVRLLEGAVWVLKQPQLCTPPPGWGALFFSLTRESTFAVGYGAPAGSGGLGLQAATALTALAGRGVTVHAFGPGRLSDWPLQVGEPPLVWHRSPKSLTYRALRYSWWRWYQGHYQLLRDRSLGRWAKRVIERLSPECCYV